MKLLHFHKWTKRTINYHDHGFIQEINKHYLNINLFGWWWKEFISWDEYINYFPNDWNEKPY